MTSIGDVASSPQATPAPKQVVRVPRDAIEAARARVNMSRRLGWPVSKVVEKIAAIPTSDPRA